MPRKAAKKGTSRKRRLVRLGNATGDWPDDFSPSAADWVAIENAYEHELDDGLQAEICELVTDYLRREQFERNAPFVVDAQKWLAQLDKRVRDLLWSAEAWRGSDDDLKHDAALEAQLRIVANMKHPLLEGQDSWRTFFEVVADVAQAIKPAREDLAEQGRSGFVEGAMWDWLVVTLAERLSARGLPVKASRGGPTASPEPSAYVRFVRAIQQRLPEAFCRHHSTYQATAEAVLAAKRRRNKSRGAPT